jgi:hypothetical protein
MTNPRFPFVVGCARSGTTLARAMLDAHPMLAVPGESYFPVWLARRRARYEEGGAFRGDRYVADLLDSEWFRRWELPESEVRAALDDVAVRTFPDAVRATYHAYARRHAKPRYADKTPSFVLYVEQLAALFPESCFIHVVRDGRDTALSLLDVDWGPTRFDQAALHWKHHVASGRRAGRALAPDRYLEVRYEDLTDDPGAVARRLCEFIDVPFAPDMLRYFERADRLISTLPDPKDHANLTRRPERVRSWREALDDRQVALFTALAGRELAAFGYDVPDGSRTSAAVATRALAARARRQATRRTRQAKSMVWRALKGRRADS